MKTWLSAILRWHAEGLATEQIVEGGNEDWCPHALGRRHVEAGHSLARGFNQGEIPLYANGSILGTGVVADQFRDR
jgi:hypothetical protein